MDVWKWAAIGLALSGIAGCHTPQAITALERECRMLEDQIYVLEDELSRAESALEACQSRCGGAAQTGVAPPISSSTPRTLSSPALQGPQLPSNGRDSSRKSPADPVEIRAPEVETGNPLPPGKLPDVFNPSFRGESPSARPGAGPREGPPPLGPGVSPLPGKPSSYRGPSRGPRPLAEPQGLARGGRPRRLPPPSASGASVRSRGPLEHGPARQEEVTRAPSSTAGRDSRIMAVQAIALDPRADNTRADRITLNRNLTGGYSRDARFGDAGVSVLIEPRDVQGRLVPAAGPVSVVVLDRGRSGDAARVARWDFTAEQISTLYRKTPYGEGIYLEMPWPGSPPDRGHLHLFVRYTTQDGRNLEASCELDVVLPAQREQAWLPLAAGGAEPRAPQPASEWRQKVRGEEPSPAPSAVVESPRPANGDSVIATSAAQALPDTTPKQPAPRRPKWSPLRPEG